MSLERKCGVVNNSIYFGYYVLKTMGNIIKRGLRGGGGIRKVGGFVASILWGFIYLYLMM